MEKIMKMPRFSHRFIRYVDKDRLRKRGFPIEPVSEEEESAKSILPSPQEDGEEEEYVPQWVAEYLANPKVKPVNIEKMREILSKLESPLSDAIIEERHGKESR